jgi:hypothetical protein
VTATDSPPHTTYTHAVNNCSHEIQLQHLKTLPAGLTSLLNLSKEKGHILLNFLMCTKITLFSRVLPVFRIAAMGSAKANPLRNIDLAPF